MDAAALEQVYGAFQDFHPYFAPLFGHREARVHSRHYLQALLVQSGEWRNAENLSETVPASARVMQRFLAESPWDDDTVIGRLQEYLGPRLGHPGGVWALDGSAPLLPVQCSGGYPVGDPGIRGRLPVAYRNGFETEKSDVGLGEYETRTWAGRHHHGALCLLGGAFLLSLHQAWGEMPWITGPQVYRVVREMLPRERFGPAELLRWLEDTQDSNERASRSRAKRRAVLSASPNIPP